MTNGDVGHQDQAGDPLALRRAEESREAARRGGVKSLVLEHHDGELLPTLARREELVHLIRKHAADLVVTHRPNDYHPDHRYTSQLVQDSAYMVTVPHFAPGVPALRKNPVFAYFMDRFQKPYPFHADVAVAVDDAMDTKWQMLDAMESQVYEWLPWHDGALAEVPQDKIERLEWLKNRWGPYFEEATGRAAGALRQRYGNAKADATRFAELFEISEYGHQPSESEIRALFPFFPESGR